MEIVPVGEESLGVRSMCLYVETRDLRILLDAGVSLAPRRFGLPPHPLELQRAREVREQILRLAAYADVVTISHYHRDHFTVPYPSQYMATDSETYKAVYGEKTVLAKSPHDLNWSQRRRHYGLAKALDGVATVVYADGGEWRFGTTVVRASGPLWHGPAGSKTGRVIAFAVSDGEETLAFIPDVEGPVEEEAVHFAEEVKPTVVVVGGPPTYLGWDLASAVSNLKRIVDLRPRLLVLAHHLLRDVQWREKVGEVLQYAERRGVEVATYAKLAGREEQLLEARRRELYGETGRGEEAGEEEE